MENEILDNIFELLNEKNIGQKDFAKAIGIPPQVVSDWKGGRNKSYKKHILQIAEFFNVSVDYLINKHNVEEPCTQSDSIQNSIKNPPANAEGKCLTKEQWEIAVSRLSL